MARTNEVMRDARIGEAEALMESKVCLHANHGVNAPLMNLCLSISVCSLYVR